MPYIWVVLGAKKTNFQPPPSPQAAHDVHVLWSFGVMFIKYSKGKRGKKECLIHSPAAKHS